MNDPAIHVKLPTLPRDDSLRINRLSIADLLLITLGTAIAIWILQPSGTAPGIAQATVAIVFAPLYGAAIAATLLAISRSHRNLAPFATQPGHRLLLLIGTTFAAIGLAAKGISNHGQTRGMWSPVLDTLCVLVAAVLLLFSAGLLLSMAFGELEESPRWRRVFQLTAAMVAVPFVGGCCLDPLGGRPFPLVVILAIPVFGTPILLFATMLAAIIEDLWRQSPRDFWHWIGVAAFFGIPSHLVLFLAVEQYSK